MSMIKTYAERQKKMVADWNAAHPLPGAAVEVRLDSGEVRRTVTESEAQMLSGHTAVIWLEGISGAYALDRVTAIETTQPVEAK